jgi:hypothetical protein
MIVIGAILGFVASHWVQVREESSRKQSMLRLISSSIKNDLSYTVGVTEGLRDNMLKTNFVTEATLFRELYHPSVFLPDSSDIGLLDTSVVNALDEYRRHLIECETRRQEYIHALEDPTQKNAEITCLTYVIGLDSAVLTGTKLLREIKSHYPETSGIDDQIASYSPLQGFISDLQRVMNDGIRARLKKP